LTEFSGLRVDEVDPQRLHVLRRRVLRGDDPVARVDDLRDREVTSLHLAGIRDDEIVVCASFFVAPFALDPGALSYQLRFMATDPAYQGRGGGTRVLAEAERRLGERGATRLWANARDTALAFYRSAGWVAVEGSEFMSEETRLPHTVIYRPLVNPTSQPDAERSPH
jgi:GNAT superfamily N-acetyltransferase